MSHVANSSLVTALDTFRGKVKENTLGPRLNTACLQHSQASAAMTNAFLIQFQNNFCGAVFNEQTEPRFTFMREFEYKILLLEHLRGSFG